MALRLRRRRQPRDPTGTMSVVEHLTELRKRLVLSIAGVGVGTIGGWFLYGSGFNLALRPFCDFMNAHRTLAQHPHYPCRVGFVMLLILAFGAAFEFPLLLISLTVVGVLSSRQLRDWRRYALVVIAIVAAVITPSQDWFTMPALMVPLIIFYELSILISRLLK